MNDISKIIIIVVIIIIALFAGGLLLSTSEVKEPAPEQPAPIVENPVTVITVTSTTTSTTTVDEQVFCTMEAKQCPDGTYVGRQGPKCEFAPCPGN